MARGLKPKGFRALYITMAQISQMVVGVVVTLMGFYYSGRKECWMERSNTMAAFAMYGSYLLLFLQFFIARYFNVKKASNEKKIKKKKN